MTLREALIGTGMSLEDVQGAIDCMTTDILEGADPEDVLEEYGLEPDYVLDLLEEL